MKLMFYDKLAYYAGRIGDLASRPWDHLSAWATARYWRERKRVGAS